MNSTKNSLVQFVQTILPVSGTLAEKMVAHFETIEIKKNEYLLKSGKICNEYLFLESGFLRSFTLDINGNEVTTNFFSGNQIVFEVASFFQRIPSQESIQALQHCKGWFLTYEQLNALFHEVPEFREMGRAILVKGFVALKKRTLAMINETAEQRYTGLLQSNPQVFQQVPLKHIASYLGITDTSLSRIRKEYAKK